MTFGSLFAGIGGMDLGLERAGMVCRWQVEIDPFCRRVLAKHWPDVKRYEDVRELTGAELERVDVIAGGFPCQDVSRVGAKAGIDGKQSGLWSEFLRLACALRPRFIIVENVAGLLDGGMGRVLADLAESGFDADWRMLTAAEFGLPHLRQRLFIVAYTGGSVPRTCWLEPVLPVKGSHWQGFLLSGGIRKADGVPREMDRLVALGNAVVPQCSEWVGRAILKSVSETSG